MKDAATETKRFKNKIKKESGLPATATVFAVLALGCVCAVYWPVFAQFNTGGMRSDPTVYPLTVIYGLLFSALLLYAVFTGTLAKRTLIPAAVFSVPVFLYYFIEKVGVLEYLVFHTNKDLFFVYENNPSYYSGENLLWIILAAVFSLLAMFAFLMLCFHKKKGKVLNTVIILVAFVVRLYYAYYHLAHNEFVLYRAGSYTLAEISYAVLGHAAGVFFFTSVLLLTLALHKTELAPKHLPKAESAVQPAQTVEILPEQPTAEPKPVFEEATEPLEVKSVPVEETAPDEADKLAEIAYNAPEEAEKPTPLESLVEAVEKKVKKPRKRAKKDADEAAEPIVEPTAEQAAHIVEAVATEVETTAAE